MKHNKKIFIPSISNARVRITVKGMTPLMVHSNKGLVQTLMDIENKKPKMKKARDPKVEYEKALHYLSDGTTGFPTDGFKQATVRGAKKIKGTSMIDMKGAIFLIADDPVKNLTRIEGTPQLDERIARLPTTGSAVIAYRPIYPEWKANFVVDYDQDSVSLEQVLTAINRGGYSTGIGPLRPEKSGSYGRYEIADVEEVR